MKAYKLLAFDIDGTILNRYRRLPKAHLKALAQLHDAGYILVPVTGRSLDGVPQVIIDAKLVDFAITSNGARVTDLSTHEDIYRNPLSAKRAQKILESIASFKPYIGIQAHGESYDMSRIQRLGRKLLFWGEFARTPYIKDFSEFVKSDDFEIEKLQVFSLSRKKLLKIKEQLAHEKDITYPLSSSNYIEITQLGTDKGVALAALVAHLNLTMEDVVAIGDDTNDIPMFGAVGFSIAMGNAAPMVKKHADAVVRDNGNGGFLQAIYEYLLKRHI